MNNETIQSLRNYALADKAKTTPRTDAATIRERDDRVPVSFARQLERELQQATADNSSLAERLTAAELERDRLGAELEELQGSHDLNQIASDALNDLRADLARVTAERDEASNMANAMSRDLTTEGEAHEDTKAELATIRARVADYEERLSAVMPSVCKDWNQNARSEWPEVAAHVMQSLVEREGDESAFGVAAGSAGSISDAQEYPDCEEPTPTCDHCGGDGCIDYLDGDGGDWGEDCPSEENHLIICRHCGGTGYAR